MRFGGPKNKAPGFQYRRLHAPAFILASIAPIAAWTVWMAFRGRTITLKSVI